MVNASFRLEKHRRASTGKLIPVEPGLQQCCIRAAFLVRVVVFAAVAEPVHLSRHAATRDTIAFGLWVLANHAFVAILGQQADVLRLVCPTAVLVVIKGCAVEAQAMTADHLDSAT